MSNENDIPAGAVVPANGTASDPGESSTATPTTVPSIATTVTPIADNLEEPLMTPITSTTTTSSSSSSKTIPAAAVSTNSSIVTTATTPTPGPSGTLSSTTPTTSSTSSLISDHNNPTATAATTGTATVITSSSTPTSTTNTTTTTTTTTTIDHARDQLASWCKPGPSNKFKGDQAEMVQILIKELDSLREKVGKLKVLLGRSAKAQREAKVDLDATQKRFDQTIRENERLQAKIDKLANRPTHMELLADFETNFDRALLSVGGGHGGVSSPYHQQPVGQDTAPPNHHSNHHQQQQQNHHALSRHHGPGGAPVMDALLLQELADAKARMERLEQVNKSLVQRASMLEQETLDRKRERDEMASKMSHLELEKRMAVMEAEHAHRVMQEKAASLAEMQLEIDLVTKANMDAHVRAAQGAELIKTVKFDRQHVQRLEAQVEALKEWAIASSESKSLAQDRVRQLELQLRCLKEGRTLDESERGIVTSTTATSDSGVDLSSVLEGRLLFSQYGSFVVGAGDEHYRVMILTEDDARMVQTSERVVLRWKFDVTPDDLQIDFSACRGNCPTPSERRQADPLIHRRVVTGGAAGELDSAFAVRNACTLVWANNHSWIKPRTVKFVLDAIALPS